MTTETTVEAVQQTLAEYERLAISTGESVQIDPPKFSDTGRGDDWSPVWAGEEPPAFGRATVHRNGVPTTVYVSWAESLPAVDEWHDLWLRKPMKLFGAYTLRTGLRRAFRDVIGDRHEPDEQEIAAPAPTAPAVDRDWRAELADAENEDEVQQLHRDAKAARAVSVELEREIRKRLATVRARMTAEPAVLPLPSGPKMPTPADLVRALESRPMPLPPVTRPKSARRPQKPKARGPRD